MGDRSAIGCPGIVIVATRGTSGPGEVSLSMNGGTESYLAWSGEPLAKGTRVIVVDVRGPRTVEVSPSEDHNPYPGT
jgi:membrane protein implicated in regulation of membrane protease activity